MSVRHAGAGVRRGTGRRHALLAAGAALLLSACATPSSRTASSGTAPQSWSGRLSLRIDSEPAQSFAALFDLRGKPDAGELTLTSPIGSILAVLRWSPGEALLINGGQTKRYASLDALIEAATGAAIPVAALFGWLEGRNDTVPGWRPDLGQVDRGRLQATRESPQPQADLRIVFERT